MRRTCFIEDGTLAKSIYGKSEISERHRHRYEFNNRYLKQISDAGLVFSGFSRDGLVELIELPSHPWFFGTQFHPEFTSKPRDGHPLFTSFINAARACQGLKLPRAASGMKSRGVVVALAAGAERRRRPFPGHAGRPSLGLDGAHPCAPTVPETAFDVTRRRPPKPRRLRPSIGRRRGRMSKIKEVEGLEILDSRGNPTVEAEVVLASGARGRAAVPSGASTGSREAHELRDGDKKRYLGKGVTKAVANVNGEIRRAVTGLDAADQEKLDRKMIELDGTSNKARLGANAILAVSLAAAKAHAADKGVALYEALAGGKKELTMPLPMMNIINGGAHADNSVDIQEFMILPVGAPTFAECLRYGVEVFHALKAVLKAKGLNTAVGDEGGFAPDLGSNEEALQTIEEAVEKAGYTLGREIYLGLDVASTEFFANGKYTLESEDRKFTSAEFADYLEDLVARYPIVSVEDGMAESDWDGWGILTERAPRARSSSSATTYSSPTPRSSPRASRRRSRNSILIKPNQIGTLTETLAAIEMATKAGYSAVVSHRSGETEDATIADIAVATGATQIKTGSLCRSDRLAKYNQLLRIERALGARAKFDGARAFPVSL